MEWKSKGRSGKIRPMFSQYSRFQLPNNLRVISVPMEGVSSATVLVLVGTGSRYEEKDKAGLSHFLEHMFFKGTQKRPTAFDISSLVDSVGGINNAFTGKDHTGFYIKVQSRYIELAFDILSDTLKNSLYLQEEIDRERGTIIEEINMYEDNPLYKIDDVFMELLFDGHPLGWSTAGEKKTVCAITRDDFISYTSRFYQASDMVLVVAGKTTEEEIKALATKYFSCFERGKKEEILPFTDGQVKPQVKIKHKKTDQAHLYFGYPAFSFKDSDRRPLSVLNAILGGGMSSRLFIQVRERRGLAYYVHSDVEHFHEIGYVAALAGLNLGKIEEAIKVIAEEFKKLKDGEVKERELKKAKEFLKGRITLRLEDSYDVAVRYAEKELLEEKIETPDETFAQIDKVTAEDVRRVANRLFVPEKPNLAIIGPIEDGEKLLKLIS